MDRHLKLCVLVSALLGCGSPVLEGAGPTSSGSQDAGPPDASQPTVGTRPERPAACGAELGQRRWVQSAAELQAVLIGRWLLCSDFGLDGLNRVVPTEVGIEFLENGRYVTLTRDASGALQPRKGLEHEGTVEVISPGQINFHLDRGGLVAALVVLSVDPPMLILNNNGVVEYRYLAATP